ncbi:16S rRNA (guanine(966)-N(2))-methyltransferase RsmD [Commensalibacter oyaizuii]|uniref:16S rRNA (Guanine(966)-N(2))-methyltransferase RsmD n=1 Tax=Commensalibacter oyaizuii TaxID=3043873 RepID=A0ABT6Q205_9PROT|nr:16S rRNA (guanine(966)-N(2))-methyltransferase RsmD [Commensalibacter sp. TBRC 16381]MDI2091118.1 16S rRNA (guanine(966)-N(2))-methyltransferase RsmD [Commensalibacter sp. TBRC 16381]
MRIIAGKYKGTTLYAPPGKETRPTADRARQTLFDILLHAPWADRSFVEQAVILDAFAGTGAIGLEALSRGAQKAYFFEKNTKTLSFLEKNIQLCRANLNTILYKDVLLPPLVHTPCNLAFFDPPYQQNLVPQAIKNLENKNWFSKETLIVTETAVNEALSLDSSFSLLDERKVGAACLRFWKKTI